MMQYVDYAPPAVPSLKQQRDALQKGLGRSWMWASAGVLADAPLLESCLRDMRFDQQCEEPRSAWLWKIVQHAGAEDRLRAPIFGALSRLPDERSAQQLCELAYRYAQAGHKLFRSRLGNAIREPMVLGWRSSHTV